MRLHYLSLLLVLFFTTVPFGSYAQKGPISYEFVITVSSQEEVIPDAEVRVFEKNELLSTHYTDQKGRFDVQLLRGESYIVEISKEGYYTKRLSIITNVEEGVKKLPALKFETELTNLDVYRDAELNNPGATSILDFPSMIIEYDPEIGDFNYREAYHKHVTKEVKKINSNY